MKQGLTEDEADAAALEAAKAFRADLVRQGLVKEPKAKDPQFTSDVVGVRWRQGSKEVEGGAGPQADEGHGRPKEDPAAATSRRRRRPRPRRWSSPRRTACSAP